MSDFQVEWNRKEMRRIAAIAEQKQRHIEALEAENARQDVEIEVLKGALRTIGFSRLSLSTAADEENRRHARTALSTPDSKGSGT